MTVVENTVCVVRLHELTKITVSLENLTMCPNYYRSYFIQTGKMMFRSLFILFLLIPLLEIYVLIQVGSVIGAGWTVFLVVATAVIGAGLLRMQGFNTLQRAQTSMARGEIPAIAMLEGVALLFSGALLLTPGFFTDAVGFALLVPVIRQSLIKHILKSGQFVYRGHAMHSRHGHSESTIIEGEIVDNDEEHHLK